MSKTLIVILIVLGVVLIAYNATLVDFNAPFSGDSTIALIGIMAALCAIVLLLIYLASKKIKDRLEDN
ncbi:MAG: hypothetical protein AB3N16_10305 [Flavobacteriaceae bacterium]